MNRSAVIVALVPPGVVTFTSTVPLPAGLTAVICVLLFTVKRLAATVPNSTLLAPVKLFPRMITLVPPASGPDVGEMLVSVGIGGIGGATW